MVVLWPSAVARRIYLSKASRPLKSRVYRVDCIYRMYRVYRVDCIYRFDCVYRVYGISRLALA